MELTRFGVWTSYHAIGEENAAEAARLVESLGFGTFWLGGSPQLPTVRPLLEATERLVVATGIVNVWAYEPARLAAEFAPLNAEFPERLLVGVGIGHREATQEYARPLPTMRGFLDGLDAAVAPLGPADRCLAALKPRMVALAGERSRGVHPYFTPVQHTREVRRRLGAGPLVAPELACVIDTDADRADATAREYATRYLQLSNYVANLRDFGFTDEDFADGGSDRLLDAVVPRRGAADVAGMAGAHLDAGADHVCLQPLGVAGIPAEAWTALARELI